MHEEKKLENIRHSLAHLLAAAVLKYYPGTKLGIGPIIESGFYYDFLFPEGVSINDSDLEKLEKEMKKTIEKGLEFSGKEVSVKEAKDQFKDQPFKLDLIDEFVKRGLKLTIYKTGDIFTDLCRGGHVKSTKEINPDAFKLTHIAGAYWRGNEKNPMLTRIYGAAFNTKKELEEYLEKIEKAKELNHRKLGKELGLFIFSNLVGPGLPLFTPKGRKVLAKIKDFSRELRKEIGYEEVQTPQINKAELFKISGHYEKYRNDMFRVISNYTEEEYFLKPMNCPQHTQLYASKLRSYRDLPVKYADFSLLYRDEKPGELSGLTRLRSFSQDDGHCFCREDQIEEEFSKILYAVGKALNTYKLNYYVRLSLWDEKNKDAYLGNSKLWEKSQGILKTLVEKQGVKYEIAEGEAAFYGPKVDFVVKDSLGREWQLSTIQLDINMPARFGLEYIDEKNKKQTPVMIHSALVGSPERFLGILIEHYGGAFPTWLAPIQAVIIPISRDYKNYAKKAKEKMEERGAIVEINDSDETLNKRIREAERQKVPYIIVVGKKEEKNQSVAVRKRGKGKLDTETLEVFANKLAEEIREKN